MEDKIEKALILLMTIPTLVFLFGLMIYGFYTGILWPW